MLNSDPHPNTLYPIEGVKRVVFLKNIIRNPQILVGDYTYYDDILMTWVILKKMLSIYLIL